MQSIKINENLRKFKNKREIIIIDFQKSFDPSFSYMMFLFTINGNIHFNL